jgi:23S rRNA-/tRNA-specific pseudouridylate synthase
MSFLTKYSALNLVGKTYPFYRLGLRSCISLVDRQPIRTLASDAGVQKSKKDAADVETNSNNPGMYRFEKMRSRLRQKYGLSEAAGAQYSPNAAERETSVSNERYEQNEYASLPPLLKKQTDTIATTNEKVESTLTNQKAISNFATNEKAHSTILTDQKAGESAATNQNDSETQASQVKFIHKLKDAEAFNENHSKHEEALVDLSFGMMRLDNMNRRKTSNQTSSKTSQEPAARPNLNTNPTDQCLTNKRHDVSNARETSTNTNSKGRLEETESKLNDINSKSDDGMLEPKDGKLDGFVGESLEFYNKTESGNLFDEQYFGGAADQTWARLIEGELRKNSKGTTVKKHERSTTAFDESPKFGPQLSSFDINEYEQYVSAGLHSDDKADTDSSDRFGDVKRDSGKPCLEIHSGASLCDADITVMKNSYVKTKINTNIFEEQYFDGSSSGTRLMTSVSHNMENDLSHESSAAKRSDVIDLNKTASIQMHQASAGKTNKTGVTQNVANPSEDFQNDSGVDSDSREGFSDTPPANNVEIHEPKAAAWEKRLERRPLANVDDPRTGYDLAMKLRLERKGKIVADKTRIAGAVNHSQSVPGSTDQALSRSHGQTTSGSTDQVLPRRSKWGGRLDSKGFRILEDQTVDVQRLTEDDLINVIRDSIIYEDEQVLVIDKPYGLPSHGGPGVHHSVGKLLPSLAAKMDRSGRLDNLHLVHRLDKETTGVMILAKSLQLAEYLLTMFKKRQVVKNYWLITKGVPDPAEGIIDIQMGEGTVGNMYRMELRPKYPADMRQALRVPGGAGVGQTFDAITNYRVLSTHGSAALVECTPETGVKHQIRCHMAFGLNTPILGDHKYSHYTKIVPQRLYPDMLQQLGIRQAKARHVPMHLHAKAVVLPEFRNGRNLFLSARLPKHFVQNMKWLKLTPPTN